MTKEEKKKNHFFEMVSHPTVKMGSQKKKEKRERYITSSSKV
jgi:hypothetical protein